MPRLEPLAAPGAASTTPGSAPPQGRPNEPPFERVAQGLEMRELESQTVFDQLFGGTPRR